MEESVTGVRAGRDGTPMSQGGTLVMETGAATVADQGRAGVSPCECG